MGRLAKLHGEDAARRDAAGDLRRGRRGRAGRPPRRASTPASTRAARSSSRGARRACRRSRRRSRSTGGSGSGTATGWSTPRSSPGGSGSPGPWRRSCPTMRPSSTRAGSCAAWRARSSATGRGSSRGPRSPTFRPKDANGRATLVTARGEVRAPVVVLAGEAYLTELPGLHRQLVPLWSLIVLTEPLSGRPVGRDRLGQPRDAGLDPALGRLPVTHRGRPDPVRRPRRAVPLRVADPARVRPPRPDPRPAAGVRARVVPDRSPASGSPTPGAGRWACPATGTRRWRSTRRPGSRRLAATSVTACPRRTSPAAR